MTGLRFQDRPIHTIFFDVRGTLIPPAEDTCLTPELRTALVRCLSRGARVVFATGVSLHRIEKLVLGPLIDECRKDRLARETIANCVAYVDSATCGYSLCPDCLVVPLAGFEFLRFSDHERRASTKVIRDVSRAFRSQDISWKLKPGQINCYIDRSWCERRMMATQMNLCFKRIGLARVTAQVPSSRRSIDVALCTKSRAATDFLERSPGVQVDRILVIADSLQQGGMDEALLSNMPTAIGVHVGVGTPRPQALLAQRKGPSGTVDTLHTLLAASRTGGQTVNT